MATDINKHLDYELKKIRKEIGKDTNAEVIVYLIDMYYTKKKIAPIFLKESDQLTRNAPLTTKAL